MITQSNYFAEMKNMGISKLTPSLAKTHAFIEKITQNGRNWEISNPVLSEVIKNHLILINAFEQQQAGKFLKDHVIVTKVDHASPKAKAVIIIERIKTLEDGFKWAIVSRPTAEKLFTKGNIEIFVLDNDSEHLAEYDTDLLNPDTELAAEYDSLAKQYNIQIQKPQSKVTNFRKTDIVPAKFNVSKGDVLFDNKKQENITVTKVVKPSKNSGLKDEPFLIDLQYKDGKKAINMPIGERFVKVVSEDKIERIKPKKAIKKKFKSRRKFNKPEKAPITVRKFSLELQHIKKYLSMEGKNIKSASLFRFEETIRRAINSDDYLTHKMLLVTIHSSIAAVCENLKESKIEFIDNIKLTPEFKTKCKDIVDSAKVRIRTEYLAGFDRNVYMDIYRKKYVLIDQRSKLRWANELFKTMEEAKKFAKDNNLEIIDKPENLGCDCEKKK
jgi:hypothetical protein